jgi:hypothetical protein
MIHFIDATNNKISSPQGLLRKLSLGQRGFIGTLLTKLQTKVIALPFIE